MNFIELTEEEFDNICENFEESSFYQTTDWAKIKEFTNWIHYYVGVKKDNKIVACSLILGKSIYLNQYLYYAPRGMLLDYHDNELLTFFVNNIKKYLKEKNGIIFKIDPLVEYQHHDKYGNVLNDNFTNQSIIDNLKKLGFKHHGFTKGYTDEAQFRWSYCLDIKEKEELLKDMDQRCRRCIRKSEKYPLEIVNVNDDNIKDFKDIMEHTANRQKHFDRKLEYYKNLDIKLKEKSKLVIIYLDKNKFIENFKDDKLYEKVLNDKREKIPISAGVFIFDKNRANYVYGGTYQEYMSLMAPYKMQMEMIEYTKKLGISLYDFGGISGSFKPKSKNYGVYEFKRGFGGYVVEYIGEFDLILNFIGYNVYDKGYDVYRELKHIMAKVIKNKQIGDKYVYKRVAKLLGIKNDDDNSIKYENYKKEEFNFPISETKALSIANKKLTKVYTRKWSEGIPTYVSLSLKVVDIVTKQNRKYYYIKCTGGDISGSDGDTIWDGKVSEASSKYLRCLIDVETGKYIDIGEK